MNDVLTPPLALAYLAELQPSIGAVGVFDDAGRLLAGDDPGPAPTVLTASGAGFTIRAAGGGGLDALARLDLDTVLAELAGRRAEADA
jgi:hypothetical protein